MSEKERGSRRDERRADSDDGNRRRGAPLAPELVEPEAAPPAEFAAGLRATDAERVWVREQLGGFFEKHLIVDVLRRVKAGKEATVYLCSAHPSTQRELIAAKLYRGRSLRSSRNVGQYQEGRAMLDEDGNSNQGRSWRMGKAIAHGSARGKAAVQTSWLMHDFTLLGTLHAKGADVPEPIAHGEHALLMEFIGEGMDAAPTLNDVALEHDEAERLFARVMFNVDLLLGLGWIHGDLSAYNILYRAGRIVLIDFPQVVDCRNNPKARAIFERDVDRVAEYFARFGVHSAPRELARELWEKHVSDSDPDPEMG